MSRRDRSLKFDYILYVRPAASTISPTADNHHVFTTMAEDVAALEFPEPSHVLTLSFLTCAIALYVYALDVPSLLLIWIKLKRNLPNFLTWRY